MEQNCHSDKSTTVYKTGNHRLHFISSQVTASAILALTLSPNSLHQATVSRTLHGITLDRRVCQSKHFSLIKRKYILLLNEISPYPHCYHYISLLFVVFVWIPQLWTRKVFFYIVYSYAFFMVRGCPHLSSIQDYLIQGKIRTANAQKSICLLYSVTMATQIGTNFL